ncbi:MAG: lysophospholipid acyltransferase family protein, partial [Luminiphilus sp.]
MPVSPKPLWLEWTVILLIRLMIGVTRLMPLGWARALGRVVGAGLYHFNGRMRRVALRNLELAYPEWTPHKRRVMAKQSVQSTGELMSEMGRVWTQPWGKTAALLEVDGLGCVTEPLASGQGVIVLGSHLGNWELLGMHLATVGNLVALYEPIPLKKLDELV